MTMFVIVPVAATFLLACNEINEQKQNPPELRSGGGYSFSFSRIIIDALQR